MEGRCLELTIVLRLHRDSKGRLDYQVVTKASAMRVHPIQDRVFVPHSECGRFSSSKRRSDRNRAKRLASWIRFLASQGSPRLFAGRSRLACLHGGGHHRLQMSFEVLDSMSPEDSELEDHSRETPPRAVPLRRAHLTAKPHIHAFPTWSMSKWTKILKKTHQCVDVDLLRHDSHGWIQDPSKLTPKFGQHRRVLPVIPTRQHSFKSLFSPSFAARVRTLESTKHRRRGKVDTLWIKFI